MNDSTSRASYSKISHVPRREIAARFYYLGGSGSNARVVMRLTSRSTQRYCSMPELPDLTTNGDTSNLVLLCAEHNRVPEKSFARQCIDYARGELGKHPQMELIAQTTAPIIVGSLLGIIVGNSWSSLLYGLGAGVVGGYLTLVAVWIIIFLVHLKRAPATLFKQKQDEIVALNSLVAELRKADQAKANKAQLVTNLVALHAQGTGLFQKLKTGRGLKQGDIVAWQKRTADYLEQAKGQSYATEFMHTHNMLPPGESSFAVPELVAWIYPRLNLLMEYIRASRD